MIRRIVLVGMLFGLTAGLLIGCGPEAYSPKSIGKNVLFEYGQRDQYGCLEELWDRESGWNPNATNPSSGAHGIPQALPAWKMASAGSDYMTNAETQIHWGVEYIKQRYGGPCNALAFWHAHYWY